MNIHSYKEALRLVRSSPNTSALRGAIRAFLESAGGRLSFDQKYQLRATLGELSKEAMGTGMAPVLPQVVSQDHPGQIVRAS